MLVGMSRRLRRPRRGPVLISSLMLGCGPTLPEPSEDAHSESGEGQSETEETGEPELDPCARDSPVVSARVTLEGQTHVFEQGWGQLIVHGDEGARCIDFALLRASSDELTFGISLGYSHLDPEGDPIYEPFEPFRLYLSEDGFYDGYQAYEEDLDSFEFEYEIHDYDHDFERACASFSLRASQIRARFHPTDDPGPYVMSEIEFTFSGPIAQEESYLPCEGEP